MSIKKILVPTDFSECAERASNIALLLAGKMSAELIFLHLFPDPVSSLHIPVSPGKNYKFAHPEISKIKIKLDGMVRDAERKGVTAKGVLVYDKGNDSIEEFADSYRADLIVMGSHGAHGMVEWFAGSNAQHVSMHSDIPVLVIKNCFDKIEVKNILFASSFNENVISAMLIVTQLAQLWDATIHLLFVNLAIHSTEKKAAEAKMFDLMKKFPDSKFTVNFSDTNDEEFAISRTAEKLGIDMITLTPHDRDGLVKFFSHSIAENLVNHELRPVLVLPEVH
jgi:nucleotide-binding universal stress UspA family protein